MTTEKEENYFVCKLIENVEKRKCLYDKMDPFYFNRNVKERAWKEIGGICDKSGADCKHKWKLLRERFVKELKRMDAPSGSGMGNLEWKFLQHMLFLKDSLAPRRTRDNVGQQDTETEFEQSIFSADSLLEPMTPSPTLKRRCKTNLDSLCQKFGETIDSIEKSLTATQEETTDESFMKTVVCLMKDLPINVKDEFQAGIIQELYRLRIIHRNN